MNLYQNWTPEDENRLIRAYEKTYLTVREIAQDMGRGVGSIQSRLSALMASGRIETRRKQAVLPAALCERILELYNSGMKYVDIAKETGQSYNRVSGVITNHRRKSGLRVQRGPNAVEGSPRSTGNSALDAALETLRKELHVLSLQQARITEKAAQLRRTIARVERIAN